MGKKWNGNRRNKRGSYGGGGGGGGGYHDLTSCRGFSAVLCTCDVARERESSKELINILVQAVEEIYSSAQEKIAHDVYGSVEQEDGDLTLIPTSSGSIEAMLKGELAEVRQQAGAGKQEIVSVNTGVKGIVMAKIINRKYCPIRLVTSVFDRVRREHLPCSRNLVRMVPLKWIYYPNEEELKENLLSLVNVGILEMDEATVPYHSLSTGGGDAPAGGSGTNSNQISGSKRKSEDLGETEGHGESISGADEAAPQHSCGGADEKPMTSGIKKNCTDTSDVNSTQEAVNHVGIDESLSHSGAQGPTSTIEAAPSLANDTQNQSTSATILGTAPSAPSTTITDSHTADTTADLLVREGNGRESFTYTLLYKARNHNVLNRHIALRTLQECMPSCARLSYRNPKVRLRKEVILV